MFSEDKIFDEPNWGTFDTNDDIDSVWGFNASSTTKEVCKFSPLKIKVSFQKNPFLILKRVICLNFSCFILICHGQWWLFKLQRLNGKERNI